MAPAEGVKMVSLWIYFEGRDIGSTYCPLYAEILLVTYLTVYKTFLSPLLTSGGKFAQKSAF